MRSMTSKELRQLYLDFFVSKGHAIIPSASLIPENDPTVLFTTAGMHPLVPYLMGAKHPEGTRLVDVQKCVRTGDIDEVGDSSHCTFFEMLGNWSLGDYFKKESIAYSWEFLTSEKWLGIDPSLLFFTCFEGDENAPRDTVAYDCWVSQGVKPNHIVFLPKKNNWWGPAGLTGPCGPDTEIFYDTGKAPCGDDCKAGCDCGKYLEIWNNVFMEYNKTADGTFEPLAQKNVDTGMGLDRTVATLQGVRSVYDTDAFAGIIASIPRRFVAKAFAIALPALSLPVLIRLAVTVGVATATEVSTIGIVYTVALGVLAYRQFEWRRVWGLVADAASISGAILFIIGAASAMGWALTQSGFSSQLAQAMAGVPGGRWGFLAVSIVAFIVLGMVLEGIPALVVFAPLLFPIARSFGIHDVQYAMVVILAMGVGVFAPPMGIGFFIACAIGKVPPAEAMRPMWPYLGALVAGLLLVAAVPWISTGFL